MVAGTDTNGKAELVHPSPSAFAHAVLRTTPENYETMIQFYLKLLHAEIVHYTPRLAFLRYDHEHHRIAIANDPNLRSKQKDDPRVEVDHLAYTYSNLTELAQVYTSMKTGSNPVLPVWTTNHGPTTSIYYLDPDGNRIECQVDNFDTAEAADAFMKGPLFSMNPIGTDFDAEEWAQSILSKANPDGSEGLTAEDAANIKTRREIGERFTLPAHIALSRPTVAAQ